MKNVDITVDGEDGRRYSIRCRCCKVRFMAEVQNKAILWMGELAAFAQVPAITAHVCPKIHDWTTRGFGREQIIRSAFRWEIVRWGAKPSGILTTCGSKCLGAKGPDCDCKCLGVGHGRGR
jgi:hypothetical protein